MKSKEMALKGIGRKWAETGAQEYPSRVIAAVNLGLGMLMLMNLLLLSFLITKPNFPPLFGFLSGQFRSVTAVEPHKLESSMSWPTGDCPHGLCENLAATPSLADIGPETREVSFVDSADPIRTKVAATDPIFKSNHLMGVFPYMIGAAFLVILHIGALVGIMLAVTNLLILRAKAINGYLRGDSEPINKKIELAEAYFYVGDFEKAKGLVDETLSN